MSVLIAIPIVFAVAAWVVAAGSWLLALQHRKADVRLSELLLNGLKSFDSKNFTEAGQVHQRRFLRAFGVFFLALFLTVGTAFLATSMDAK